MKILGGGGFIDDINTIINSNEERTVSGEKQINLIENNQSCTNFNNVGSANNLEKQQ